MQTEPIEQVTRHVFGVTRRRIAGALGGLALAPLLGPVFAGAKKTKKKKKTLCLNGQTVQASGKKVKKLTKQGATPGACASCVPQCNGTSCGGSDGCGGTCGCNAGSVCHEGTCARCTVTCTGTPQGCGSLLSQALLDGGTIIVCPGRYSGLFVATSAITLIGAGPGDDPATSTILDAQGDETQTLTVAGPAPFVMSGVRLTGGTARNLMIYENSDARLTNCTIAGTVPGAGIFAWGKLRLTNSTVADHDYDDVGAGIYFYGPGPHFINTCVISGNTSTVANPTDGGGGIYTYNGANVTISGTEIRGNTAFWGGGILMDSGTVKLDSATTITNNTATQTGGGVARYGGTFIQNGATISGNTAPNSPDCAGQVCT